VLPWNLLKNPTPVEKVLVINVDAFIVFDVIFADEILLTKNCWVLNWADPVIFVAPNSDDIEDIPSARIEYNVEFVEPIDVLILEK